MKSLSMMLVAGVTFAVLSTVLTSPVAADDKQACIKKEQAKGTSACIAKAKCNGVTSRKEQARMCN